MKHKTLKEIESIALKKYPENQIISALGGFEDSNLDKRRGFVEGMKHGIEILEKIQNKLKEIKQELADWQN